MYYCINKTCQIHIAKSAFPVMMDCPLCKTPLEIQITYSEQEQNIINSYPYIIAFPFQCMLQESSFRSKLDLLATGVFLNGLKYLGLLVASEYYASPIKSVKINELFKNNLYRPSFGNWNHFLRETIKELESHSHEWKIEEILNCYQKIESGKKVKRYETLTAFTNEFGEEEWRTSKESAISTLINFRNKYLGHGTPLNDNESKELYEKYYPILLDFIDALSFTSNMKMYKAERTKVYELMGTEIEALDGVTPTEKQKGRIWVETNDDSLDLLPFYILPGNIANADKVANLFIYEQFTGGNKMIFFSPESKRGESQNDVIDQMKILIQKKEEEEAYSIQSFSKKIFNERVGINNQKVIEGLQKEQKVIAGAYYNREASETALKSWIGAQASLFLLAAHAGSGKTNVLSFMTEEYAQRNISTVLMRAVRFNSSNIENEIIKIFNLEEDFDFTKSKEFKFKQSDPFIILIDGINENTNPSELLKSIEEFLTKHKGGGIKIIVSWRVNLLDELPEINKSFGKLIYDASDRKSDSILASKAFLLTTLDRKEMKGVWDLYYNHKSKRYKPQFSLEKLTEIDRPLSEQLENPLLLKLFMQMFNGKGLKNKGKGFTNFWDIWWKKQQENKRIVDFLKELAVFLANKGIKTVSLDDLLEHPTLSKEVENIQVDSAYIQLIKRNILSQFFIDEELVVGFTMEAVWHYILSEEIDMLASKAYSNMKSAMEEAFTPKLKSLLSEKVQELTTNELKNLIDNNEIWEAALEYFLIKKAGEGDYELLMHWIDSDDVSNKVCIAGLAQAFIIEQDIAVVFEVLLEDPTENDIKVLEKTIKLLVEAQQNKLVKDIYIEINNRIKPNDLVSATLYVNSIEHIDKSLRKKELANLENIKFKINSKNQNQSAEFYIDIGSQFKFIANYDKAIKYDEKALAIRLKSLGKNHPKTAIAYNNLGGAWMNTGEYNKAIDYYTKALVIYLNNFGKNHPDVGLAYNNLGLAWSYKKANDKAIEYYEKSLAIKLKSFGENHTAIALAYNNLGVAFLDEKGEIDKAIEYNEKALVIYLNNFGKNHPDVALAYHNLGGSWYRKGEYNKAIEYYEKSLAIKLKSFGKNHPGVGTSYNNLALAWNEKGENDKAIEYYKKALASDVKAFGENHPKLAINYNNLGVVYNEKGDNDKAIECYEKVLAINIKSFGDSHPDVAESYNNLAFLCSEKGDNDKAIEYYKKALAINLKSLGEEHSNTTLMQFKIGAELIKQKKYKAAIDVLKKGFEIDKNSGGYPFKLAVCYENLEQFQQAIDHYVLSAIIRKDGVGVEHEATQNAIKNACRLAKKSNNIKLLPPWINKLQ